MKKSRWFKYYSPKLNPINWVSIRSGNKYAYSEYTNHGSDGLKRGLKALPKWDYPFKLEYEEKKKIAYLN